MLCPNCKQVFVSGAKFCSNCGAAAPKDPSIMVSQDVGTVSGTVTGVAAGKGGLPGGTSVNTEQKIGTVTEGGAVAGVVFGGEAPVHVGGHQQYGDTLQGDEVTGDKINVGNISGSSGVAIGAGAQSTVRTVHTSGGDYAEGSIDKRQGSFVQGGQTTISGVTGSNINVGSTLTNVSQSIGAIAHGDDATKAELQQLIAQLNAALQRLPATQAAEAEAVAELTKQTVDQATKPQPNRMLVQISAEGLKQAAENLAEAFPIALKIAELVMKLVA
jgi:hypothetical protein